MTRSTTTTERAADGGSPRLIDSITEFARKVAHRDLDWPSALATAHRMFPAEVLIALRQAIATLGEAWARACYEAVQREIHAPEQIWVDDLTEVGESAAAGITVAELHGRLGAAITADPDVGAMRVVSVDGRDVVRLEVGRTREPPVSDGDYVLVLHDR
jgi:hypothetical protein